MSVVLHVHAGYIAEPVKSTTTAEASTLSATDVQSQTTAVVSQATLSTESAETNIVSGMTGSHYAGIVIGVIAAAVALLAVVIYSIRHYSKNLFPIKSHNCYELSIGSRVRKYAYLHIYDQFSPSQRIKICCQF